MQVVSLEKTNTSAGRSLARQIANNFLNNVLRSIQYSDAATFGDNGMLDCRSEERSGNIYEKYNCTGAGRPGGGGEYDVQVRRDSCCKTFIVQVQLGSDHQNYHSPFHLII